jgi:hypothetical protein
VAYGPCAVPQLDSRRGMTRHVELCHERDAVTSHTSGMLSHFLQLKNEAPEAGITAVRFLAPSERRHPGWRRKAGLGLAGRSGSTTGSHHELGRRVDTDRASAGKGGSGAAEGRPSRARPKTRKPTKALGGRRQPAGPGGAGASPGGHWWPRLPVPWLSQPLN